MRRFAAFVLVGLWLALPAGASAQDAALVVGAWEMTMETPRGEVTQVFTFAHGDDGLSGIASNPRGETALQKVAFRDGTLTFEVVRNMRGNSMTQSFSATVEGDEMTGTMSGGRGGARDFVAKRQ